MFSNKKDMFRLMIVIFAAIAFYVGLNNINVVLDSAGVVISWFSPVIIGLALAFVLNVFVRFIEEHIFHRFKGKKWLRPLSIVLTLFFIICVLSLLVIFIVPEIKRTVLLIAQVVPIYFNNLIEELNSIDIPIENFSINDIVNLEQFKDFTSFLTDQSVNVLGNALNITTSFAGTFFNSILSIVIAIYVLVCKEKLGKLAERTLYAFLPRELAEAIHDVSKLSYSTFYNFITGQLTEAVILGTLCYLGMKLFGFPYATAIGMLVGITALIPIVGAFIGTAIGAFLIVMVSPLKALLFIVYLLILQQIEGNLIYPKVVGKSVGLPGILVITAVLVGGRIGGIAAVLLSVPICSILYSLFKTQLVYREKKNIDNNKEL